MSAPGALIKACLNGARRRDEHPAIPVTPDELALAASGAVAAGAGALHVHPRATDGNETLDAAHCAVAVEALRLACPGIPIGLSTGLWIVRGDEGARRNALAAWTVLPDFVSVNLFEPGAVALGELVAGRGIAVEAGLGSAHDARALVTSPLADRCLRLLVEIEEEDPDRALAEVAEIDDVLEGAGIRAPRLYHGTGATTWAVIESALRRGRDVRVGLEDTLVLADGSPAADNAHLVTEAAALR